MEEFLLFHKSYEQILIIFIFYWTHKCIKLEVVNFIDKITESTPEDELGSESR